MLSYGDVALLMTLRVLQFASTRSASAPDEFWQAPEIAHRLAFGTGAVTWEWRPDYAIRSSLHAWAAVPAMLVWHYVTTLLPDAYQSWSSPHSAVAVLHLCGTIVTDVLTIRITARLHGPAAARAVSVLQAISWPLGYFCARPLINSVEMLLLIATLSLVTCLDAHTDSRASVTSSLYAVACGFVAALCALVRPSAAPALAALGCMTAWRMRRAAVWIIPATMFGAVAAVGVTIAADTAVYGFVTLTPLNFIRANVLQGLDQLYGAYPWYWYLVNGLPAMAALSLPLIITTPMHLVDTRIVVIICAYVVSLSCISHKEHRFLLPIVPLLNVWAAVGWTRLSPPWLRVLHPTRRIAAGASALVWWFLNTQHQAGGVAAVALLRSRAFEAMRVSVTHGHNADTALRASALMDVHFLQPCHSSPAHASVHAPIALTYLDCSPPARIMTPAMKAALAAYSHTSSDHSNWHPRSETDAWNADAVAFLLAAYGPDPRPPLACAYARACNITAPPHEHAHDFHCAHAAAANYDDDGQLTMHRDERSFMLTASSFAAHYGPPYLRSENTTRLIEYRPLPSHVVINDVDELRVAQLLQQHAYSRIGDFHHAHVAGDVHAARDPRRVRVYEHACWSTLRASAACGQQCTPHDNESTCPGE